MAAVETSSFALGMEKEMEYAALLFQSGQARALQYAFFAQRKAVQVIGYVVMACCPHGL